MEPVDSMFVDPLIFLSSSQLKISLVFQVRFGYGYIQPAFTDLNKGVRSVGFQNSREFKMQKMIYMHKNAKK